MRTLIATVLVFVACAPVAFARTWTDSSGTHTVEAELVDFKDGIVRLKKEDGSIISVPIEKLSDADQQFVRSLIDKASRSKNAASTARAGVSKKNVIPKSTNPPVNESEGAFDKRAFDAIYKNAQNSSAKSHAMKLGLGQTNLEVYIFLVRCGQFFVRDGVDGSFRANAGQEAFTAAVLNVTPEMIRKARQLTGDTSGDSDRGAVFILLSGCGPFVDQTGKFSTSNFSAAFENLNKAKVDKAAGLLDEGRDFALTSLLTASGEFLDSKGVFDASHFNSRLDAQEPTEFVGNKDDRLKTFFRLLKP